MMTRMRMADVLPEGYRAMVGLERWTASSGIDRRLHELIKIRASQINGCVFWRGSKRYAKTTSR
jgi:alkylhydroperoxidase family enzyme